MADQLSDLVGRLEDTGPTVLFVSPHLDDAVLSCGALLAHLARTCRVTVLTVFTSAALPPRWGLAAKRQLSALGVSDGEAHFHERRAEDISVLERMGASWIHLGLRDALFRRVDDAPTDPPGSGRATYPTFRFHAGRGRIARSDAGLAAEVGAMVGRVAIDRHAQAIFGPLGIGRHVDHMITRTAVRVSGLSPVYYSDFPYSETEAPDPYFLRRAALASYQWSLGRAENQKRIAGYRTQVGGLFPRGIPLRPEVYWIPAKDSASTA